MDAAVASAMAGAQAGRAQLALVAKMKRRQVRLMRAAE